MCPVPFYPTLCALSYLIEKVKRLTGKGLCVCVCVFTQTDVYFHFHVCVCVCMDPCTFIYVCIWMYVQLCMCLRNPYFDLFHSAWVLNYSCVCVCSLCAFLRVCVCVSFSVAPVISLLLPASTPVLQLTCSVLGPTRSYRTATAFYPFPPSFLFFLSLSAPCSLSPCLASYLYFCSTLSLSFPLASTVHLLLYSLLLNSSVPLLSPSYYCLLHHCPPPSL